MRVVAARKPALVGGMEQTARGFMSNVLDISEARKRFNTLDKEFGTEPIIYIKRHGKDVFAVVNTEYLETVMETMEILSDPKAAAMLQASIDDIEQGRLIDQEDIESELLNDSTNTC